MLKEIEIRNFKCFEHLRAEDCRRINVLVGDNGSGKTALLEAIFLALASTSELILRYRAFRGLDGRFGGTIRKIEDAIWNDYFYRHDQSRIISINLSGSGPEARSLTIARGSPESLVPLDEKLETTSVGAMRLVWRDASGHDHPITPIVSATGPIQFPETGENLPDFFYFSSTQITSSIENAERFSDLSRAKRQAKFVELFAREYDWIEDLSVEVVAQSPAIFASVKGLDDKVALSNVSGGINRIVAILLAIASRPRSVLVVDEIENGLHHKHHLSFWRMLLSFARTYDGQIFASTHNEEWLDSLAEAAGDDFSDIALWRMERSDNRPVLRQLKGKQAILGIKAGEVR